ALFRRRTYPDLQEVLPLGLGDVIRNCWSESYSAAEQIPHDLRKTLPIFTVSQLIFRRFGSPPETTTLLPLNQIAVNDLPPSIFSSLYFFRNPKNLGSVSRLSNPDTRPSHLIIAGRVHAQ